MTSTEVKIFCGGKNVVNIFDGEDDVFTIGNFAIGFENTDSNLMLTIKVAKSSEMLGNYELTYHMGRNEAYVLLGVIEAYIKMQKKNITTIED